MHPDWGRERTVDQQGRAFGDTLWTSIHGLLNSSATSRYDLWHSGMGNYPPGLPFEEGVDTQPEEKDLVWNDYKSSFIRTLKVASLVDELLGYCLQHMYTIQDLSQLHTFI
jgi:hypothetical protein